MFKKFLNGVIFGAGFGVAFSLCVAFLPMLFLKYGLWETDDSIQKGMAWRALSHEEQMEKATVLVVSRYQPSAKDSRTAYVSEIHKKRASTIIDFEVGDLRKNSRYFPEQQHGERNGTVTLYAENPAVEMGTYFLFNDNVALFGNMPLETLIEEFMELAPP